MDLTNQFLIAMPSLADPNFHRTVTLMCAHSEDGAMGIVINRPTGHQAHVGPGPHEHRNRRGRRRSNSGLAGRAGAAVERGFVIHHPPGEWEAVLTVGEEIGIATSKDILAAVAEGRGPEQAVIALGYAGWGAGQLEHEVQQNAWLSGPAGFPNHLRNPLRGSVVVGGASARHRPAQSVDRRGACVRMTTHRGRLLDEAS